MAKVKRNNPYRADFLNFAYCQHPGCKEKPDKRNGKYCCREHSPFAFLKGDRMRHKLRIIKDRSE